jgi:hypothetical protein
MTFDDGYSDIRPKGFEGAFRSVNRDSSRSGTPSILPSPVEIEFRREDSFFDRDEYVPKYNVEDDEAMQVAFQRRSFEASEFLPFDRLNRSPARCFAYSTPILIPLHLPLVLDAAHQSQRRTTKARI